MTGWAARIAAVAAALTTLVASPGWGGVPTEQLRGSVDRVIQTLESPAYKGEAKLAERRMVLRKIANEIFDFPEMARRSMGRHWQARSPQEREEFTALMSDLLERSYIAKIESYGGEKILYTTERVEGDIATVNTKILSKTGAEIPVDYRLFQRGPRWLVYDVNIEGVSLVSNYRTQFNKIIQTASYEELVRRMKVKQEEFDVPTKTAPKAKGQ
jgi:phospholipid transport system substrate-binding protein